MPELSEIIQDLVENSNSMNQIDSKTAIQYVVEAYESGMDKARRNARKQIIDGIQEYEERYTD